MTHFNTVSGTKVTLAHGESGMGSILLASFQRAGATFDGHLEQVIDCMTGYYAESPLAKTVRQHGGTHSVNFIGRSGGEHVTATLILAADAAALIKAEEQAAAQSLAARKAAEDAAQRDAAVDACPQGYVTVRRTWSASNYWHDRVVALDGTKLGIMSGTRESVSSSYLYAPAEPVAAMIESARRVEADRADADASLLLVEVPAAARVAWRTYGGSAEAAWEAEDETAWGLIRRFGAAIQAQG